jgi:hypothetical protein
VHHARSPISIAHMPVNQISKHPITHTVGLANQFRYRCLRFVVPAAAGTHATLLLTLVKQCDASCLAGCSLARIRCQSSARRCGIQGYNISHLIVWDWVDYGGSQRKEHISFFPPHGVWRALTAFPIGVVSATVLPLIFGDLRFNRSQVLHPRGRTGRRSISKGTATRSRAYESTNSISVKPESALQSTGSVSTSMGRSASPSEDAMTEGQVDCVSTRVDVVYILVQERSQ